MSSLRFVLIALVLGTVVTGCAGAGAPAPPVQLTEQSRCERFGGVWRDNACQTGSGGGGY